ncbi:OLC1v1010468C1 [Oldenlandia corymbosa var. corymbosa]|uniref:OLC1v1010468C1 n=1 Tax=Oldenlandia corymbosa var. corymbosa TaxID=529605 RepID=A0AAV1DUF5_OLDCO|nr:OLC1v1010468C1 [Oldenlandia corymbosa var. corymbosa]
MGKLVNSDFGLIKCAEKEQTLVDWIDQQLPDEILVSILSYLPLEDAAKTRCSVKTLGKSLGLLVSGLNFDSAKMWEGIEGLTDSHPESLCANNRQNFINWVNQFDRRGNVPEKCGDSEEG